MLYCVIGKSSTGKDTIYKRLLTVEALNLKNVVSYTTRPIREKEVDGVEYHFVTEKERDDLEKAGKVIELRRYETCFGPWDYFTVASEDIEIEKYDYIIIGTLESFEKIRNYYGKEYVKPIYIEVEDGLRLQRALNREKKQKEPKYDEMCRRFLADAKDFAPDNLEKAGVTRIFKNIEKDKTVNEIAEYILSNR